MTVFSRALQQKTVRRWGMLLIVVILLGILLLSILLSYRQAAAAEMLPVSIQSMRRADYSADPLGSPLSGINMGIVQDIIQEQEPSNVPGRLETVQAGLQTPIASATPVPTSTPTQPGPTNTLEPGTTATSAPPTSALPSITASLTSTVAAVSTQTPTSGAGASLTPSATSPGSPTNTATPTNSPPTQTPTATPTATSTFTPIPSATNTAVVCIPPDRDMGFVAYTIPADGATNVPVNTVVKVVFNQPVDPATLATNIKVDPRSSYSTSYNPQTKTLSITFIGGMEPDEKYTINIKKNLKNLCGDRQKTDVKIIFKTEK